MQYLTKEKIEKIKDTWCKAEAIKNNIKILDKSIDDLEIIIDLQMKELRILHTQRRTCAIDFNDYTNKRDLNRAVYNYLNDLSHQKIAECNEWKKLLKS